MEQHKALSMDNQILYKLGGIESQVASIRDDITKVVRRLEERIEDDRKDTDAAIKSLTERVAKNEKTLTVHDDWIKAWSVRSAMVLGGFSLFWLFAGGFILDALGKL